MSNCRVGETTVCLKNVNYYVAYDSNVFIVLYQFRFACIASVWLTGMKLLHLTNTLLLMPCIDIQLLDYATALAQYKQELIFI